MAGPKPTTFLNALEPAENCVLLYAGRNAGPSHVERHADVRDVGQRLALGQGVLAQVIAVVRGEDDVRVVQLPNLAQLGAKLGQKRGGSKGRTSRLVQSST